ncbi:YtxH domain-containing protein [Gulosibacter sp. GYB002]|uniref:YtxH domain-containing protein n=1 Tax=Gulosibacter sp. GYB002 TaxID=2994391 RepID=UPI002F96997B
MKTASKIALFAGLATGYVLGARAGRERYDQIARQAGKLWNSKPVQRQAERVQQLVDRYVPSVVEQAFGLLGKGASALTRAATGASRREAQRKADAEAAERDTVPEGTVSNPA